MPLILQYGIWLYQKLRFLFQFFGFFQHRFLSQVSKARKRRKLVNYKIPLVENIVWCEKCEDYKVSHRYCSNLELCALSIEEWKLKVAQEEEDRLKAEESGQEEATTKS